MIHSLDWIFSPCHTLCGYSSSVFERDPVQQHITAPECLWAAATAGFKQNLKMMQHDTPKAPRLLLRLCSIQSFSLPPCLQAVENDTHQPSQQIYQQNCTCLPASHMLALFTSSHPHKQCRVAEPEETNHLNCSWDSIPHCLVANEHAVRLVVPRLPADLLQLSHPPRAVSDTRRKIN